MEHDFTQIDNLGEYALREGPRLLQPKLETMFQNITKEELDAAMVTELLQDVFQQIVQNFKTKIASSPTVESTAVQHSADGAVTLGNTNSTDFLSIDPTMWKAFLEEWNVAEDLPDLSGPSTACNGSFDVPGESGYALDEPNSASFPTNNDILLQQEEEDTGL